MKSTPPSSVPVITNTSIPITCDANTRATDDFLTVLREGDSATILLGGKPLSKVKDSAVLHWAAQAISDFFLFDRHAPIPSGSAPEIGKDDSQNLQASADLGNRLVAMLTQVAGDAGTCESAEECLSRLLAERAAWKQGPAAQPPPPGAHEA